jgi:hypothetical protein
MAKRIRSPNYPALSLPDAIERVTTLHRAQHTHAAPREVAAKGMGYNTLNGASATAISALHKYGLLDRVGDEIKVSDRALRVLHPHSPEERAAAIREAAREPQLFGELAERFPGRMPSEELLRNYLIRNGFAPAAVSAVVLAYRETWELVERETAMHDSLREQAQEHADMVASQPPSKAETASPWLPPQTLIDRAERPIGRYDYEDGSYVRIVAGGDLDTEAALEMVETLIGLKRKELARRKARNTGTVANAEPSVEKTEPQHSTLSGPDEGHLSGASGSELKVTDWETGGRR